MSNVCWEQFRGWLESFSALERALSVAAAGLLAGLLAALVLLTAHLLQCAPSRPAPAPSPTTTYTAGFTHNISTSKYELSSSAIPSTNKYEFSSSTVPRSAARQTTDSAIKCSWTPSATTVAATRYYEDTSIHSLNISAVSAPSPSERSHGNVDAIPSVYGPNVISPLIEKLRKLIREQQREGEEAGREYRRHSAGLVKLNPPGDASFGCTVTVLSARWGLTAASCLRRVEEKDSLRDYVIVIDPSVVERLSPAAVTDVRIHPGYSERRADFDLAALAAASALSGAEPALLATFFDYTLLALADELVVLEYGESRWRRRRARRLAARRCEGRGGASLCAAAGCGLRPGAPLLRAGRLLALVSGRAAAADCRPAPAVPLPAYTDWIYSITRANVSTQ